MIKDLKPFPISEEMLGAYLESNLSLEEAREVEDIIGNNDEFCAFVNEVTLHEIDESVSIENDFPNWNENFELPEIKSEDLGSDKYDSLFSNTNINVETNEFPDYVSNDDLTSYDKQEFYRCVEFEEPEYENNLNTEYNYDNDNNEYDVQWDE